MLRSFEEIREKVRSAGRIYHVAIPSAEDEASIEAAVDAKRDGIADSILLGNASVIGEMLRSSGSSPSDFEMIDLPDGPACAVEAVRLVRENRAELILKGRLDTPMLLKACLDREKGLRTDRLLSDVFVFEDPLWDDRGGKLVGITDGGITPAPTLEQKRQILENAVEVFRKLGCETPNVAVMSATEKVSDRIASTADAKALVEMWEGGEIKNCVVEGPHALDTAALAWCAEMKGMKSRMAGRVDIMLMPSFEAGNITAKVFVFYMKRRIGHVIMGARAPILINSRTDDSALKLNSIALSILAAC
jgi:phosphate butyryltransferase